MSAFSEWRNLNPLRKFRGVNDMTMGDVAVLCDVTYLTVQHWEHGMFMPTVENMAKLSRVVGRDIDRDWIDWNSERPVIGSEASNES